MQTKDFSGIRTNTPLPNPCDLSLPSDISDMLDDYVESTLSQLEELEQTVLQFEKGLNKDENLALIKRILHKIKGESAMVGIEEIAQLCHQTESALEELPDRDFPDMLLRFNDWTCQAVQNMAC